MARGLPKDEKTALIEGYRTHEKDTGSPEVQIAVLSKRIEALTAHIQQNRKDFHTRLGLTKLVAKRRRLLNYLKDENYDRYRSVIERLKLRR